MSQSRRMIWLFALVLFVSGCAGYRPAVLPGSRPPDEIGGSETAVTVGSQVKLVNSSGVVVSGKVLRISEDFLVLELSGKNGVSEYQVELDQISSLEVKEGSSVFPILLVGAVLVVVVVAVAMANSKEAVAEIPFVILD